MARQIIVDELRTKIEQGEELQIIDVRDASTFGSWQLLPHKATLLNIPVQQLSHSVHTLNKKKPVYVICYRGFTSQKAAAYLEQNGFTAFSVEGGMKAWASQFKAMTVVKDKQYKVIQFQRISKNCLSYMIISKKEAIVIDPSMYSQVYKSTARKEKVNIVGIIDTHLQADHVSGSYILAQETGAVQYCSPEDFKETDFNYTPLQEGKELKVGSSIMKVLKTPGHTLGSISLLLDNTFLFTGDTLFIQSVGRPDLAGRTKEWARLEYQSLQQLLKLGKDVMVLPSHYAHESEKNELGIIGHSFSVLQHKNEVLSLKEEKNFVEALTKQKLQQPETYSHIREINAQSLKPEFEELEELEMGPNLCAATK